MVTLFPTSRRIRVTLIISVSALFILASVAYLVRPHGTLRLVIDGHRLPSKIEYINGVPVPDTLSLSAGEHSILLICGNPGLPLRDVSVSLMVRHGKNSRGNFSLLTSTEPSASRTIQEDSQGFGWNHSRVFSLSRKVHRLSISTDESCLLDVVGFMLYPWRWEKEIGLAAARAMVRLEFSAPENSTSK